MADDERYVNIPSFIFRDRSLAALEAIVVYLKDSQGLTYAQIARLLNRDDRTIWTTYTRAKKKGGTQ
ncbi:MAG: sigma-70 region 4 domain-containing protein [Candidatus Woesearchaeota archaeon]|nr:sigma-70 region 4 domain-containing protein [Candidatus Woesearchaeota archaeon]